MKNKKSSGRGNTVIALPEIYYFAMLVMSHVFVA